VNHAEIRHGEAQDVAAALEASDSPDLEAMALALANALSRIHALELRVGPLRAALQGVLDPFHEGQVSIRPEAEGYVQAAIDAGEEALKA
jgi:hypothetical protein